MKYIAKNDSIKGICFALLGYFFFGICNAIVKTTTKKYNVAQILTIEFGTIFILLSFYLFFFSKNLRITFQTLNLKHHLLRSILAIISLSCIFYGFKTLPLSYATALGFSQILFLNIMSLFFLQEKTNSQQWKAILIGFVGMLIITNPYSNSSVIFQVATFIMLTGACLDCLVLLYPRKMRTSDSLSTILIYYAFFSCLIAAMLTLTKGWKLIDLVDVPFLIGLGIFALLGQLCVTQAFRLAPAGLLSPSIYTLLLWDTLFGYLFWNEIPKIRIFIGALIVIISGAYTFKFEQRDKGRITSEVPSLS